LSSCVSVTLSMSWNRSRLQLVTWSECSPTNDAVIIIIDGLLYPCRLLLLMSLPWRRR